MNIETEFKPGNWVYPIKINNKHKTVVCEFCGGVKTVSVNNQNKECPVCHGRGEQYIPVKVWDVETEWDPENKESTDRGFQIYRVIVIIENVTKIIDCGHSSRNIKETRPEAKVFYVLENDRKKKISAKRIFGSIQKATEKCRELNGN